MTKLDDFTLPLLTNDEVIETNQDELGAQAELVAEGPRGGMAGQGSLAPEKPR